MKKWQVKAVVQKSISFLPFPHEVNALFQKYVTRGLRLTDEYFTDRLTHAGAHVGAFRRLAPGATIAASLELGTGWYPVVPVGLFLSGARTVHTVDISAHCRRAGILATLRMFASYFENGTLQRFLDVRADRWKELCRLVREAERLTKADLLEALGIDYLVADARRLPLPARSLSLITSNNTFEHVYAPVLRGILAEFKRLAAPGAVMSHAIDMSDHFAHFDRSITIYNYLQYSDRQWQRIDNAIQPQNRGALPGRPAGGARDGERALAVQRHTESRARREPLPSLLQDVIARPCRVDHRFGPCADTR